MCNNIQTRYNNNADSTTTTIPTDTVVEPTGPMPLVGLNLADCRGVTDNALIGVFETFGPTLQVKTSLGPTISITLCPPYHMVRCDLSTHQHEG